CGGCDLLHVAYDEQCAMKEANVKQLFEKAGIKPVFLPIVKNDSPLFYRHKVVLSATTKKKRLRLGLYRENTREVIPYIDCKIHHKKTTEILMTLEELLNQYKIPAYDIQTNQGIIKHILIRISHASERMLLVFVTQGHLFPNAKKIIQELLRKHDNIDTVIQNIHRKRTHLVLLEEEKILYGKGFIFDEIDGLKFQISARSFYQINPEQMFKLYQIALNLLDIQSKDRIVDTYSGIGTISLLASRKAKEVIAIESNANAHHDALLNKRLNQIHNVHFIEADVSEYMRRIEGNVDGLIMDPTREGSTIEFIDAVKKLRPKKIVYISCEPKTQVRDLIGFMSDYDVVSVQAIDMFSETEHVESITLLSLK
ncbi:MAG: 23S rRNA (uracil(1939)-C(5))-methyltransferase RlmD, partial [Candidatus Moranbacteria bacterium]|nr:23S rRNA (uracil(1939)-C(5))-methyltransferase RlmD [Candidatus Moranbacteria bacterium]